MNGFTKSLRPAATAKKEGPRDARHEAPFRACGAATSVLPLFLEADRAGAMKLALPLLVLAAVACAEPDEVSKEPQLPPHLRVQLCTQ